MLQMNKKSSRSFLKASELGFFFLPPVFLFKKKKFFLSLTCFSSLSQCCGLGHEMWTSFQKGISYHKWDIVIAAPEAWLGLRISRVRFLQGPCTLFRGSDPSLHSPDSLLLLHFKMHMFSFRLFSFPSDLMLLLAFYFHPFMLLISPMIMKINRSKDKFLVCQIV